jgi:hypothetical protein
MEVKAFVSTCSSGPAPTDEREREADEANRLCARENPEGRTLDVAVG